MGVHYDGQDFLLVLFVEPGEVFEHPPVVVRPPLRLVLHVNQD